jgi:hypothetical protein
MAQLVGLCLLCPVPLDALSLGLAISLIGYSAVQPRPGNLGISEGKRALAVHRI